VSAVPIVAIYVKTVNSAAVPIVVVYDKAVNSVDTGGPQQRERTGGRNAGSRSSSQKEVKKKS
jgi:hypothetical protein